MLDVVVIAKLFLPPPALAHVLGGAVALRVEVARAVMADAVHSHEGLDGLVALVVL